MGFPSLFFKILLKFSSSIFFYDLYIFILDVPLKIPDFRIVETNLSWSEIPVSKVLDNLNKFFLLVSIRSVNVGLLDWKHVDLLIILFKLSACISASKCWFSVENHHYSKFFSNWNNIQMTRSDAFSIIHPLLLNF